MERKLKTSVSKAAEKFNEVVNIWMAIHESQEFTRLDVRKYSKEPMKFKQHICMQSELDHVYTTRVDQNERMHAKETTEIITENNLQEIVHTRNNRQTQVWLYQQETR